ncbi:thiamine phosphate synthase [Paenibacillus wenxiniae]|uniref:Thiamine phosphate synthase n=1 Tax=Paenibacillus wenxiniae TaxID=1636843 RepID=A0ABW4RDF2_9BACL
MEIHVITPAQKDRARLMEVASCIYPHVTAIHIRQKSWSWQQVERFVNRLLDRGIPASKLVLNEHAMLALEMGLGGVHLPEHVAERVSLSPYDREYKYDCKYNGTGTGLRLRIGRSVHSIDSALQAERVDCDYVFYGHVYATASKPGIPPRGIAAVQQLCNKLRLPVMAIGGIQPTHIDELHAAGVAGIALMSGIFEAAEPESQLELYRKQIANTATTKIRIGSDQK